MNILMYCKGAEAKISVPLLHHQSTFIAGKASKFHYFSLESATTATTLQSNFHSLVT